MQWAERFATRLHLVGAAASAVAWSAISVTMALT